ISVEKLDETFNRIALSFTNGNDLFGQDDNLEDVSHLDDNCDEEVINLDDVNDSHLIITESIDLNSSLLSNNNILSNEIYEENDIDHGDTNFDIDELKDRTTEFNSAVESIKSWSTNSRGGPVGINKTEFSRMASAIGKDICVTAAKLHKLTK
ncbi:5964_t:CDS:2, partial [Entrophospora sp. SA101]